MANQKEESYTLQQLRDVINSEDFPELYKHRGSAKPLFWAVSVNGSEIVVSHGVFGGVLQTKKTTCSGKNIGSSNETTANEQAVLEARAKYKHQINREDYHPKIELSGLQTRPMLALDYNKDGRRVNWADAVVQPKLDGLRLVCGSRIALGGPSRSPSFFDPADRFELMTRKGESYNLPHLVNPAKELIKIINDLDGVNGRCLALDGEVYLHGVSLQKITSRARAYQEKLTDELEYHVFDLVIPYLSFEERNVALFVGIELLKERSKKLGLKDVSSLKYVPCNYVDDEAAMKRFHGEYMVAGFEGVMIRNLRGGYDVAKRSKNLFKYKEFKDKECLVIGINTDVNGNAMFTCLWNHLDEGTKFDCTPKRTHIERKEIVSNASDFIGRWVKVKYQALTDGGMPQFPVGLEMRECDENGQALV